MATGVRPTGAGERDGLLVRPLGPGDRPAYVAALTGLSAESWRQRWGRPRRMLTGPEVDAFLAVGGGVRIALAVEDLATGRIVGVARSSAVAGDPAAAELSAVVSDEYQRSGLGTRLLDELIRLNRERGTRRVVAMSDGSNAAARRLLRREEFLVVDHDHGTLYWERPLPSPTAAGRTAPGRGGRSRTGW